MVTRSGGNYQPVYGDQLTSQSSTTTDKNTSSSTDKASTDKTSLSAQWLTKADISSAAAYYSKVNLPGSTDAMNDPTSNSLLASDTFQPIDFKESYGDLFADEDIILNDNFSMDEGLPLDYTDQHHLNDEILTNWVGATNAPPGDKSAHYRGIFADLLVHNYLDAEGAYIPYLDSSQSAQEFLDDVKPLFNPQRGPFASIVHNIVHSNNFPLLTIISEMDKGIIDRKSQGITPLQLAAATGNKQMLQLLILLGADVSLETPGGFTAADLAIIESHDDLLQYFPSSKLDLAADENLAVDENLAAGENLKLKQPSEDDFLNNPLLRDVFITTPQ